jgi:hypothetical protein
MDMNFLATMTMRVPDATPRATVEDVYTCDATTAEFQAIPA